VKPAELRDVRRHNLSLVLRGVASAAPLASADRLETGLDETTVSTLVVELIELTGSSRASVAIAGSPRARLVVAIPRPAVGRLHHALDGAGALWARLAPEAIPQRVWTPFFS
jgi:hypothetical protein